MANPAKNSPVAEQLKDLMASDTTPVALKCAKIALGSADTAGGILGWQNPEASAILVVRIVIDRTNQVHRRLHRRLRRRGQRHHQRRQSAGRRGCGRSRRHRGQHR